jgi:hypothetical protein
LGVTGICYWVDEQERAPAGQQRSSRAAEEWPIVSLGSLLQMHHARHEAGNGALKIALLHQKKRCSSFPSFDEYDF